MSCLLMYKQRFLQPNYKTTPSKNSAHIVYIGSRPGVMKEPGAESGLFGYVNKTFRETIPLEEGSIRVMVHSRKKLNVYRSVISLTTAQAEALGLKTLQDWKAYVKDQIPIIAKGSGISMADIEWEAAIHQKSGHPHVHIAFWDTAQKMQVQYLKPGKVDSIRIALIKSTYPQLYQEYVSAKNEAKAAMSDTFKQAALTYEEYLQREDVLSQLRERLPEDELSFDKTGLSKGDIREARNFELILSEIYRVRQEIAQNHNVGRFFYQLMPAEIKSEIDNIVNLILQNEKLRNVADRYISARLDLYEMYTSDEERLLKAGKEYAGETHKMLANKLLQIMKDIEVASTTNGEDGAAIHNDDTFIGGLFQLLCQLSHITRNYRNQLAHLQMSRPESQMAKAEQARKARDKNIGVEY